MTLVSTQFSSAEFLMKQPNSYLLLVFDSEYWKICHDWNHSPKNLIAKVPLWPVNDRLEQLFNWCGTDVFVMCVLVHNSLICDWQVLAELKEYATEVDVDFVRKAVRAIGRCAIKVEVRSPSIIRSTPSDTNPLILKMLFWPLIQRLCNFCLMKNLEAFARSHDSLTLLFSESCIVSIPLKTPHCCFQLHTLWRPFLKSSVFICGNFVGFHIYLAYHRHGLASVCITLAELWLYYRWQRPSKAAEPLSTG